MVEPGGSLRKAYSGGGFLLDDDDDLDDYGEIDIPEDE
jgi:hypothetical protein